MSKVYNTLLQSVLLTFYENRICLLYAAKCELANNCFILPVFYFKNMNIKTTLILVSPNSASKPNCFA